MLTRLVKPVWAGVIAFLGPVAGALLNTADMSFGDISDGVWVSAAILGLIAGGGIAGWQAAPASLSSSVKPKL